MFAWTQGVAGSVLYANANTAAMKAAGGTAMPPSWGWSLGEVDMQSHVEIAPAPAMLHCTDQDQA